MNNLPSFEEFLNEAASPKIDTTETAVTLDEISKGSQVIRFSKRDNPQFKDLIYKMDSFLVKSISGGKIVIDASYADLFKMDGSHMPKKGEEEGYGVTWYTLYTYAEAAKVYQELIRKGKKVKISPELEQRFK